jgi:hypothetical protein
MRIIWDFDCGSIQDLKIVSNRDRLMIKCTESIVFTPDMKVNMPF